MKIHPLPQPLRHFLTFLLVRVCASYRPRMLPEMHSTSAQCLYSAEIAGTEISRLIACLEPPILRIHLILALVLFSGVARNESAPCLADAACKGRWRLAYCPVLGQYPAMVNSDSPSPTNDHQFLGAGHSSSYRKAMRLYDAKYPCGLASRACRERHFRGGGQDGKLMVD